MREVVQREPDPCAGHLGLLQSRLRRSQDLAVPIESYQQPGRTDGLHDCPRVPTGSNRSIDDHEPFAELEDRHRFGEQHWLMHRLPGPAPTLAATVRA